MIQYTFPRYKWVMAIGDYVAIVLGFVLVMLTHPSVTWDVLQANLPSFLVFAGIWVATMEFNNLYVHEIVVNRSQQMVLLLKAACITFVLAIMGDFLFRSENWLNSRVVVFFLFPVGMAILSIWRLVVFRLIWQKGLRSGSFKQRTAVIGTSSEAENYISHLSNTLHSDVNVVGFIAESELVHQESVAQQKQESTRRVKFLPDAPLMTRGDYVRTAPSIKVLGSRSNLFEVAQEHEIDKFVITSNSLGVGELLELADRCTSMGAAVEISSDSMQLGGIVPSLRKNTFAPNQDFPTIHLSGTRHSLTAQILKRIFDIVVVSCGIVALLPVFAALALTIKLSSAGPIIYRSRRVGKNGRVFHFYKFRSMSVVDKKHDPSVLKEQYEAYIKDNKVIGKIRNDSRVTPIGSFMRKTSLDELPQLWNVLKGDMSLVGPRPCLPHEYILYDEWQKKRLSVTPGCTGLWQVSERKKIAFCEMVLLDYYYIENTSIWFDIQIILKTIPVMVFGRGDM